MVHRYPLKLTGPAIFIGLFFGTNIAGCDVIEEAICDLRGDDASCMGQDPYIDTGWYGSSYSDDYDYDYDDDYDDDDDDEGGTGSSGADGGEEAGSGTTGSTSGGSSSSGSGGGSDSSSSGSGGGDGSADDDDWDGDGGETTGDDGGGPSPGDPCGSTDLYTCDLSCNSATMIAIWRGDGYCHDASPDLNCAAFDYDDGDCADDGGSGSSSSGGSTGSSSSGGSTGSSSSGGSTGSSSSGGSTGSSSSGGSTGGSSSGGAVDPVPGGECSGGSGLYDCDLDCRATSILDWVGDDFCDCGWSCSGGPSLNCAAFGFDGGDCEPGSTCHDGDGIYDCSLDCLGPPSSILGLVGDGDCNTSSPDLDCSSFSYDGGDCSKTAASAGSGTDSLGESSATSAEAGTCTE